MLVQLISIFLWRMQLNTLFVHPSAYRVSRLSLHLCINRPSAAYVRLANSTTFKPICLILLTFLLNSSLLFSNFPLGNFFAKPPPSLSFALGGRPCFRPIGTISTIVVYISDRRIEAREFLTYLQRWYPKFCLLFIYVI